MNPLDVTQEAVISAAGARRIREGHLWIYSGDVVREPRGEAPAVVRVLEPGGLQAGWAFYSRESRIRLRLLSRDARAPDADLIVRRLEAATRRRARGSARGGACRLVFGESDLLPSIIIDRYAEYLVLQTLSAGAEALKPLLVEALVALLKPAGIQERNDVRARALEGLSASAGVLWGEVPPLVEIREGDVRFLVDLSAGQKTGFFLDQAENRLAAAPHARGRVLDCFTNTGAFALHFARRAESVVGLDLSPASLLMARRNAELNGASTAEFREENVFDALRELERAGERFDLVCLDPPAFAKNRHSLAAARSGYKEINLRAMRLLAPEGILVTSSCSYHMGELDFAALLREAAADVRRPMQVVEKRAQASDHPILSGVPETHYLKCFILRLL